MSYKLLNFLGQAHRGYIEAWVLCCYCIEFFALRFYSQKSTKFTTYSKVNDNIGAKSDRMQTLRIKNKSNVYSIGGYEGPFIVNFSHQLDFKVGLETNSARVAIQVN